MTPHRLVAFAATALAVALAAANGAALADGLSGADIRRDIVGRTIYLSAPLGGEFPLNYRPNGLVDGDGQALGLGRFIKPADAGRWWVDGDRLCQQFHTWYEGSPMCFQLFNGEAGFARIGE